jgi:3-phosphoshikimate 1-carboxyvinyltransferase
MKEIKKLTKISGKLIQVPSSKSYLNRALIIASLTNEKVELINVVDLCEDVITMIDILSKLGIKIEYNIEKKILTIYGQGGSFIKPKDKILNCEIAGTTTRFTIGLSLLFVFNVDITAKGRMLKRPIVDLINAIKQFNVTCEYLDKQDYLPIKIFSKKREIKKSIQIDCGKSSQFLTSILMVAPLIGLEKIEVFNLISKSYVDVTIDIMKEFGVNVHKINYEIFEIPQVKFQRKIPYLIEADWSSASYFIAIEYLHSYKLNIELNYNSVQGDRNFIEILEQIKKYNNKQETLILNMSSMPDTSMTAMIICAFQDFDTKIIGLKSLKDKESNRLQAMYDEFLKIGIKTIISDDWDSITINGNKNLEIKDSIEIETYQDHRIGMCFAVLGTKTGNIIIKNSDVVKKSFPNFWDMLDSLYE